MDLYCKNCNYKLTKQSLILTHISETCDNPFEPLLPLNSYILSKNTEYTFANKFQYYVCTDSLNLVDVFDDKRYEGCCGNSQYRYYNQACRRCKNEIGIIFDDCWAPCFIGIDENKISLKPLW